MDISKIIDFTNKYTSSRRELEYCPIFDFEPLKPKLKFDHKKKFCNGRKFIIERKFLSKFGFPAYGVHCNVWSKFKNSTIIHLAKRSCKLAWSFGEMNNCWVFEFAPNIAVYSICRESKFWEKFSFYDEFSSIAKFFFVIEL